MNEVEHALLEALTELENAVRLAKTSGPPAALVPLFARIDELSNRLPPQTDPSLLHYLRKKSYQKARLYLEGRDAENQVGHCRHVDRP